MWPPIIAFVLLVVCQKANSLFRKVLVMILKSCEFDNLLLQLVPAK